MPRRAFTLIELLVVIAIMVTLMSLIMGGVMLAKRSAMRAKAVSMLGAVASAIDQYRSLNSVYPESKKWIAGVPDLPTSVTTALSINDGDEVYAKVFSSGSGASLSTKAATTVGKEGWEAINRMLAFQLGDLASDQVKEGLFSDAWKTPLRYRPSKWYPYTGTSPRIDSETPPGADSYQLWSAGIDTKDDTTSPGEGGDDIPQWAKASP